MDGACAFISPSRYDHPVTGVACPYVWETPLSSLDALPAAPSWLIAVLNARAPKFKFKPSSSSSASSTAGTEVVGPNRADWDRVAGILRESGFINPVYSETGVCWRIRLVASVSLRLLLTRFVCIGQDGFEGFSFLADNHSTQQQVSFPFFWYIRYIGTRQWRLTHCCHAESSSLFFCSARAARRCMSEQITGGGLRPCPMVRSRSRASVGGEPVLLSPESRLRLYP